MSREKEYNSWGMRKNLLKCWAYTAIKSAGVKIPEIIKEEFMRLHTQAARGVSAIFFLLRCSH